MSALSDLIERIEGDRPELGGFRFCAEQINPLLIELGGKPICKNISRPGAADGSSFIEIEMYITLLTTRKLLNK